MFRKGLFEGEKSHPLIFFYMISKTVSRVAISALVIGSVVFFGQGCDWSFSNATSTNDGGSTTGTNSNATSTSGTSEQKNPNTRAADMRVILNALNRQHVFLSAEAARSAYDSRPDLNAVRDALNENSQALAGEVGKVYGSSSSNEFLTLWRGHVDSYIAYATATKANDRNAKGAVVQKLSTQANDLAGFFSRANPNLSQSTVRQMLTDHANLITSLMDNYASRNYSDSYTKELDADEQAGKFADALTTAIVRQYPNKF